MPSATPRTQTLTPVSGRHRDKTNMQGRNKKTIVPYEMTQPGTSKIRNDTSGLAPPKTPTTAALSNNGTGSGAKSKPGQLNRMLITQSTGETNEFVAGTIKPPSCEPIDR